MDVPCFDLTQDDDQLQPGPANGIQLTVTNDRTTDCYGKATYDLLEQACLEIKYGKEENTGLKKTEQFFLQAQRYTGLHRNVIENITKNRRVIINIKEIDRRDVYNELMKYNLEKNIMPTTTDLFNSLQHCLQPYVDIRSFRNNLVQMGYIFKRTYKNTAVVIENPAVRFQRFMYLRNMKRYREEKRPIYFICEGAFADGETMNIDECERQLEDCPDRYICAVSSENVRCFKPMPNNANIEKWFLDTLVELDEGSVIVVDNSKHFSEKYCETPTSNSLKCDMIEWLEYHQIPFSKAMSRLKLWMLIEKYTDINVNLYKIDNLVKQYGCKVQRLPDCLNNLTPASYILNIINKNFNLTFHRTLIDTSIINQFEDTMTKLNETELGPFVSSIIKEEIRLLGLDINLDNIIDYLQPSTNPEIDICLPNLID